MSLILDALKKSEAERRRGLPPSLHAQFGTPRRSRRVPWAAGAGAVLLMAGLSGGWMWLSREPVTSESANPTLAGSGQTAAQPAGQTPQQNAANPASVTAVTTVADAAAVPVQQQLANQSAFGGVGDEDTGTSVSGGGLPVPKRAGLYTPTASPTTEMAAQPPPTPEPTVAVVPPVPVSETKPAATEVATLATPTIEAPAEVAVAKPLDASIASTAGESSAQPDEKLPLMYQLPYGTRKELPKLDLTMHVYSPLREERFIVLNGKRFTLDSAAPGPELTLLDIVADGVVLEFRGQRFLLPNQAY